MAMGNNRAKTDTARRGGLVCALARPWQTGEEPSLKKRVTHVPHPYSQCPRVPSEGRKGRKTCGT
jgi:hypothetical protein